MFPSELRAAVITRFFSLVAVFLVFTHGLSEAARSDKCASRCDVSSCPSPSCPGGYVPDRCGCCLVCSPREGDPCGRKNDLPCGDGLECKVATAGRRRGSSRGVCRCKQDYEVCGSDGKTYGTVCKLKAASRRAAQKGRAAVSQAHKGPCSAPGPGRSLAPPSSPRYKFNFIADVVEKIAPAVVHIELFVRHPLFGRHVRLSSGSGFIVTHSGVIVTNAHVVTTTGTVTGRPQLRVQLHDGDAYEAAVRDVDRKADIATIKINPQKKLHVLPLGSSADLRPGEFVVAIGSPFALQNTVTTGIVSTTQRDGKELGIKDSDMDYIQTDAIINYGNSGGPLVNLDGEVIGVNTLKVTAGISFAIPSDRISRFLTESQTKYSKEKTRLQRRTEEPQSDAVKKYFLGIRMMTITKVLAAELKLQDPNFPEVNSGVLVQQVIPNSPAESGGIQAGDVIVKLDGHPVHTTEDVHEALQGDLPLLLEIRRGNNDLLFNIHPQLLVH
ncbi:serine protease HTRA3a isoform X2 [Girardinichthys multiradiatus]|uniref:serine protease HTRA3a isoform X2 n=1 Tax=Girardinichthys multiradiatus TaxID=208333 RepID=UPI001FADFF63|nr:serine protease HTRA3a isoform X2 [Girardinichthys multiradiatus]